MSKHDKHAQLEALDDLNDSDLLLILAVLAHKHGIDPVKPDTESLTIIQTYAQEIGQDLTPETITTHLRRAQIELLRRQLTGD